MLSELTGKGLLIHHWDTDGMCAARLLLEKLKDKDITNKTPHLGNYYLTQQELTDYAHYNFIIIVDMALPEDNILFLAKTARIMIFDHHLQKEIKTVYHHNPIIKGKNPDEYPSASWIVNDYLHNDINLYAILGIVGDHEQKIQKNTKFNTIINRFCKQHDLVFDDLLKMVYLLDSSYKLGDKHTVEQAPHLLLTYDAPQILNNPTWNTNLTTLNNEINQQLAQPIEKIDSIILKKINTKYNIISTITRKVAWESGHDTIVINTGFFTDKDQVYVRGKKNAEPMIQRGKEHGYKCGGKKEVLGAIVPKSETGSFIEEIIEFLKQ
jgi:hypothetical protein